MRRIFAVICVMATVLCASAVLRADTVTATLVTVDPFAGGVLHFSGSDHRGGDVVGELIWNGAGFGNADPGFQGLFSTFCLDLNDNIGLGNAYSFVVNPALATAPSVGAGGPMGADAASAFYALYGTYFGGLASQNDLQAFQLAVWSILYNGEDVVSVTDSSQPFYVVSGLSGTVITEAAAFLTTAWGAEDSGVGTFNTAVAALIGTDLSTGDHNGQDQIIPGPTVGGGVPLPESARSVAALLAGLGLFRIFRARRRQMA